MTSEKISPKKPLLENDVGNNYETLDDVVHKDPGNLNDRISVRDLLELLVCILAHIARGLCLNIIGPTLIDLRQIAQMSIPESSAIFLGQSSGFLVAVILSKPLLERFNNLVILSTFLFIQSMCTALIPTFPNEIVMIFMFVGQGLGLGMCGIGICAACIRLGGEKKNGMYLQAVYFGGSIGAVIVPFIAKPFLSKKVQHENSEYLGVQQKHFSSEYISTTTDSSTFFNESLSNHSSVYAQTDQEYGESHVLWVYIIMAIIVFLPSAFFIILYIVRDKTKDYKRHSQQQSADSLACNLCTIPLVCAILAFCMQCLLYFAIHDTYSNLLTSFVVLGPLHLDKPTGADLTSIFWISITVGRLNGIWIAKLVSPFKILVADFTVALISAICLLTMGGQYAISLWIFTIIFGLAISTVNGATISWAAKHLPNNNYILTFIYISKTIGFFCIPAVVNMMFEYQGPMVLMRAVLSTVVIMLTFTLLSHGLALKFGDNGKLTTIKTQRPSPNRTNKD